VLGGKYGGDVVGKAPGTCIVKYIVEVNGNPQSLFLGVDVGGGSDATEVPATTTVAPTTIDVDLVTEILVGDSFDTYLGFKELGLLDSSSVMSFQINLTEGDGSVCVLGGEFGDKVVGKVPGTCLVEARLNVEPSPNWEVAYFRINVWDITVPHVDPEISNFPIWRRLNIESGFDKASARHFTNHLITELPA
jgi:hypothetical protein